MVCDFADSVYHFMGGRTGQSLYRAIHWRNDLFALDHDESVALDESEEKASPVDEELKDKLLSAMSVDKLYLNADLTINDLARAVGSSPKKVSRCVNQEFDSNFSQDQQCMPPLKSLPVALRPVFESSICPEIRNQDTNRLFSKTSILLK